MPCYVAYHQKKLLGCQRKEARLARLIAGGKPPLEKLVEAALEVRDARVRVLRVRRSLIAPAGDALDAYRVIDSKIHAIEATSADEILNEFGLEVGETS